MKTLNIFISEFIERKRYIVTSWTIWCAYPWLISRCAPISFTVTRWFSFTMTSTVAMASGVTTGCAWPGRGESVTELIPFMNFLVHSYTCCSDRHASPYWTFIRPWISMGFTPSLLNKRMTERCSSLVLVTSGTATFYYCVVVLHSCIVLPPVGHSSNHEYNCCQLTRQSSCVSNFYRTFNFFHLTLPRTSKYLGESSLFSERYVVCFTAVTMEIVQNHVSDISHVKPLP